MNEKMNKEWILFHLEESKEAIEELISEIKSDADYSYGNYVVDMGHLYHHLNTAWNSRNETDERIHPGKDEDFNKWGQFPSDLPLMKL